MQRKGSDQSGRRRHPCARGVAIAERASEKGKKHQRNKHAIHGTEIYKAFDLSLYLSRTIYLSTYLPRIHPHAKKDSLTQGEGATRVHEASLAARYLEKKTRRLFDFFRDPPLPVSPGSPEVDPTMVKNKRPGFKNWVDCNF